MPGAPGTTQLRVGQPDSHNGMQGATCYPPAPHTRSSEHASRKKKEPETGRNASSKTIGHRAAPHTAVRRAPTGHTTRHKGTMRCEHYSNHQMRRTPREPSANTPPPSLYEVPTHSTVPRVPGGAHHGGGNRAVNSQPRTGQSTLYGNVKSSYGGAGGWDRRGCATWAPRSATRQGEEQHKHTERGSHTKRDKGEHSTQGGGAQQGRRGNQNSGNKEPKWSGWWSVRMGGSDNKGDGLASQPCRYRVLGQPLLNRHHVGGVSCSPGGLFAQQEREPIRGRPAMRGKRTYGGRPGQRVEEQGTWASQKHGEAGYGRPVDRGAWTAKTVKRPRQQPAHPQYANYWAPLAHKWHTMPHSAQPQHTNYWAPRMRKRHQQEHRPQRPTDRSDPTQHATGRTGDRPGPVKEQQPGGMSYRRGMGLGVGGQKFVPKRVQAVGRTICSTTNSARVAMQPTAELQFGSSNPGRSAVVCGAAAIVGR